MESLNPSNEPVLQSTLLNGSASVSKSQRYTYVTDTRIGGKQSESVVSGSATAVCVPPPVPTPEPSSETQQQQQSSSMADALFQTFVSELREFITGVHQLSDRSGVDRLLSHSKHLQTQIVRLRDTHTTQLTRMQNELQESQRRYNEVELRLVQQQTMSSSLQDLLSNEMSKNERLVREVEQVQEQLAASKRTEQELEARVQRHTLAVAALRQRHASALREVSQLRQAVGSEHTRSERVEKSVFEMRSKAELEQRGDRKTIDELRRLSEVYFQTIKDLEAKLERSENGSSAVGGGAARLSSELNIMRETLEAEYKLRISEFEDRYQKMLALAEDEAEKLTAALCEAQARCEELGRQLEDSRSACTQLRDDSSRTQQCLQMVVQEGERERKETRRLCADLEAKLKEIEERYRGELRERKACVTFETKLGRELKALITSVQTEQSKLKEAIRLSEMIPAAVPIAGSSHELPDPEALAAGANETPENVAGGRRMRDSRAASVSLSGSATQSTLLPGELQVDTRVVSPEPDGEQQQQQQVNETVLCEPEAGFGEELAEETAAIAADGRRAPPTLLQPRRQGPGIPSTQELSASARARPHSALEPDRARAVESAVRTQQQVQLARPASASVSTAGAVDGRLSERSLKQFGYIGEAQDYFDELVDRRRVTFRDRNSLLGPAANDQTQPVKTYEPLDDSSLSVSSSFRVVEVHPDGLFVTIANVSNQYEEVGEFQIIQNVMGRQAVSYSFESSTGIAPQAKLRVWAGGQLSAEQCVALHRPSDGSVVWVELLAWGSSSQCTTVFARPTGEALAWLHGASLLEDTLQTQQLLKEDATRLVAEAAAVAAVSGVAPTAAAQLQPVATRIEVQTQEAPVAQVADPEIENVRAIRRKAEGEDKPAALRHERSVFAAPPQTTQTHPAFAPSRALPLCSAETSTAPQWRIQQLPPVDERLKAYIVNGKLFYGRDPSERPKVNIPTMTSGFVERLSTEQRASKASSRAVSASTTRGRTDPGASTSIQPEQQQQQQGSRKVSVQFEEVTPLQQAPTRKSRPTSAVSSTAGASALVPHAPSAFLSPQQRVARGIEQLQSTYNMSFYGAPLPRPQSALSLGATRASRPTSRTANNS